jgi:hypothetical protein
VHNYYLRFTFFAVLSGFLVIQPSTTARPDGDEDTRQTDGNLETEMLGSEEESSNEDLGTHLLYCS